MSGEAITAAVNQTSGWFTEHTGPRRSPDSFLEAELHGNVVRFIANVCTCCAANVKPPASGDTHCWDPTTWAVFTNACQLFLLILTRRTEPSASRTDTQQRDKFHTRTVIVRSLPQEKLMMNHVDVLLDVLLVRLLWPVLQHVGTYREQPACWADV